MSIRLRGLTAREIAKELRLRDMDVKFISEPDEDVDGEIDLGGGRSIQVGQDGSCNVTQEDVTDQGEWFTLFQTNIINTLDGLAEAIRI